MQLRRISLLGAALCGLAITLTPLSAVAGIKCWTNHAGQRECGNAVPPEFAQQGHREFSEDGYTTRTQGRAKSAEELEQERLEKERLATLQEERKRKDAVQAQSDRVLLRTYTTEEDLMLARSGQLAALDSRIKHTEQIMAKLEKTLSKLLAGAASMERDGKAVSEEHHAEIERVRRQIESNGGVIEQRSRERAKIIAKFDEDLARYRALRGKSSP